MFPTLLYNLQIPMSLLQHLTLCHLAKAFAAKLFDMCCDYPSSSSQARLQSSLALFGAHTLEVPKIALSKWR